MLFRSNKSKSDEDLMVLLQKGDHHAFSIIYNRYADRLNAFFYRMLWSDSQIAEDYVHDLFSKIIERPNLYKVGFKVKPWLFQIASNMCKNGYRKKSFEKEYLSQLEGSGITESRIEREIDEEILTDQIFRTLERMPEERRSMFLLRYQQDLSVEEVAKIFDVPPGTVKSRLFHIKQTISKTIKDE